MLWLWHETNTISFKYCSILQRFDSIYDIKQKETVTLLINSENLDMNNIWYTIQL